MVIGSKYVRFTLNIIKKKLTIQLINKLNKLKNILKLLKAITVAGPREDSTRIGAGGTVKKNCCRRFST